MRLAVLTITLCLVALLLGAAVVAAQEPSALKVATVDLGRVTDEYTRLQTRGEELQQWLVSRRTMVARLDDYAFLSNENFAEVMSLLQETQPLPQDKQRRLQELTDLAEAKEREFVDLRNIPNRTAQQNDTFQALTTLYNGNGQQTAALSEQFQRDYNRMVAEAREQFMREVLAATETIAKGEGFSIVLDAAMVLMGGTDITEQVLQKLNQPGA